MLEREKKSLLDVISQIVGKENCMAHLCNSMQMYATRVNDVVLLGAEVNMGVALGFSRLPEEHSVCVYMCAFICVCLCTCISRSFGFKKVSVCAGVSEGERERV